MAFKLSFQSRLGLLIALLLILTQGISLAFVYTSTRQSVVDGAVRELEVAGTRFVLQLETLVEQLAESARVVTLDFSFRAAIASGDLPTQESVIRNWQSRVDADRVLLIDLDGQVQVDTEEGAVTPRPFAYWSSPELADRDRPNAAIVVFGEEIFELALVPVLAPDVIGWVGIGLRLDDAQARALQELGALPIDIAFVHERPQGWHVSASTLGPDDLGTLGALTDTIGDPGRGTNAAQLLDDKVVYAHPMADGAFGPRVIALLRYSVSEEMQKHFSLLVSLMFLILGALVLGLAGSYLVARGISRPVRQLAETAERVRAGDYTQACDTEGADEIAELGRTMREMTFAIREREATINRAARIDSLTGLPNRQEALRMLDQELKLFLPRVRPMGVLIVGIDRLQEINNTLGYDVGDHLLVTVAYRLRDCISEADRIARIGSDMFATFLCGDTHKILTVAADRIAIEVGRPVDIDAMSVDLTLRCGLAHYPEDGESADSLLQRADVALYRARQTRKTVHVFNTDTDEVDPQRFSMMGEMLQGLSSGHFQLYLQPKQDIATGKVTHAEALCRWKHPERGMIFPDRFIPLAEQTGHIRELTAWVLQEAVRTMRQIRDLGVDISIAVNLSAYDLDDPGLPGRVLEMMREADLPLDALGLEITESALMDDPELALNVLNELNDIGFTLSVDDYGTGYSSMSYLKSLPVQEMKIDKSFVMELASNKDDEIIVRSAIDLAHNLGMRVTAEGVEDRESYEKLREFDCELAQGYLISKPVPVEEFVQAFARPRAPA